MTSAKKLIFITMFLILGLYLALSIYVSGKVYAIVRSSYDNFGRNNPYQDIVSDEIYDKMGYRGRHGDITELDSITKERNWCTFPITYFWDGKANVVYWYSYDVVCRGETTSSGSKNVPIYITLQLVDSKWKVTNFYEPP